jgi:integrase
MFVSTFPDRICGSGVGRRKGAGQEWFHYGGIVGTFSDLAAWKGDRLQRGATENSPVLASCLPARAGTFFSRHTLRKRFRTACKILGKERLATLTIHHGRHTFISHALAGGRTLAEVRDAAGHAKVSITSTYLHVAVDNEAMGDLFRFT